MATTDELTQQINTLTSRLNSIVANSKNIEDLSNIGAIQELSDLFVRYESVSYKMSLQLLIDTVEASFASTLDLKQDRLSNVALITTNYIISISDDVVICTANSVTVSLPTAVGIDGKGFTIKNKGIGIVTLNSDVGETIDSELTQAIGSFDSINVISDGTNWVIV